MARTRNQQKNEDVVGEKTPVTPTTSEPTPEPQAPTPEVKEHTVVVDGEQLTFGFITY
jgi:hypothetical protein